MEVNRGQRIRIRKPDLNVILAIQSAAKIDLKN